MAFFAYACIISYHIKSFTSEQITYYNCLFIFAVTQNSFAQDSAKQSQSSQLLSLYYNVKDALVAGNANAAAASAAQFVATNKSVDAATIDAQKMSALSQEAGSISQTKNIEKQRELFVHFSADMYDFAKAVKLSEAPVYKMYCPMKKAYWLTSDKAVKNPYFGSAMLTCGSVNETL